MMVITISKQNLKDAFEKLGNQERFENRKGQFILMKLIYGGIGEGTEWCSDYQDEGIDELYKLLQDFIEPNKKEIERKKCPECGSIGKFEWEAGERFDGRESLVCECGYEWVY